MHRQNKQEAVTKTNYDWTGMLKRKKRATSDSFTPEKAKTQKPSSPPNTTKISDKSLPDQAVLSVNTTNAVVVSPILTCGVVGLTSTTTAVTYTSTLCSTPIPAIENGTTTARTPGESFMYHLDVLKENRKAELQLESDSAENDDMDDFSDGEEEVFSSEQMTLLNKCFTKMKKEACYKNDRKLNAMSLEMDNMTEEITTLRRQVNILTDENNDLWTNHDIMVKELQATKDTLEEHEMYGRRNGIRIYGVDETKDEDCVKKSIEFMKKELNLDLDTKDVCRGHRAGPKDDKSKNPRPILLKLIRHDKKAEIIKKREKLQGKKFVIREDVTKQRQNTMIDILDFARKELNLSGKDLRSKVAIWSTDGRITTKIKQKFYNIDSPGKVDLVKREIRKLK